MLRQLVRLRVILLGSAALFAIVAGIYLHGMRPAVAQDRSDDSIVDDIRLLREQGAYDDARLLAEHFFADNPDASQLRQRVEFEYARIYFDEHNWVAASEQFAGIVATYAQADFAIGGADLNDPAVVVDDAQYFRAYTAQVVGNVPDAATQYAALYDLFPTSDKVVRALLREAGMYEQTGDPNSALGWFRQLVAQYPDSEEAPEAQLHVGLLLRERGELQDAVAALRDVPARWPASRCAPPALQACARTLIQEELDAVSPAPGVVQETDVDNLAAVTDVVTQLRNDYSESDVCVETMLDAINYRAQRIMLGVSPRMAEEPAILELSGWMYALNPDARPTVRAKLDEAAALFRTDAETAWKLVDDVMQWADAAQDPSLLSEAQFTIGTFHQSVGQYAAARTVWGDILTREQSPLFESEVRVAHALTYLNEDQPAVAVEELGVVIGDDSNPADVRATALVFQGQALRRAGRLADALAALDAAIELQPGTGTAATAQRLREIYWRHRLP